MSADLEIRHGGVVAVDTETLRGAARRLDDVASRASEAAEGVRFAAAVAGVPWSDLYGLVSRAEAAAEDARALATTLRSAADIYEIVELSALERAAEAGGDDATAAGYEAAVEAIAARNPWALAQARWETSWRAFAWPLALAGQAAGGARAFSPLAPHHSVGALVAGLGWALGAAGVGTVPAGARLSGAPPPVVVRPVAAAPGIGRAASAPTGLADAAARVPGGGAPRVRVERYTMPDGTRQFAVYVAGTQTFTPGTREPFDMDSNAELAQGQPSASYEAARLALLSSGAEEGDVVHAFGHSQGATIAGRLALEGEFDVRTLVSYGSPIEAEVPSSVLSVSLRHTDDPVSALAGGGTMAGSGAAGSFVAERLADPEPGLRDLRIPAHGIAAYTETARLVDGSTDPRVDAVHEAFAQLDAAASVDVVEYSAERP